MLGIRFGPKDLSTSPAKYVHNAILDSRITVRTKANWNWKPVQWQFGSNICFLWFGSCTDGQPCIEYVHCNNDWLRAGRSGDRIPVEARFSAPVQTCPQAHPASCTMNTGSLSKGKSDRCVAFTNQLPSSAEVKEGVELHFYSPSGSSLPVLGWNLPFKLQHPISTGTSRTRKHVRIGQF
jgi:hypothetical protein